MRIPAALVLLAAAWSLSGCGGGKSPASPAGATASLEVRLARAETVEWVRTQPVAGTLLPKERAVVASRLLGMVREAEFAVGQPVRAGQVLVHLDAAEINARMRQAEIAHEAAVRDHEREVKLLQDGVATAESVRSLAERRRIAAAALEEAGTLLSYTRVTAPFSGVIARRLVNAGDLAAPGSPLFEIEAASGLRAEVEVPESLPAVPVGTALRIQVSDTSFPGTLEELALSADPRSRTRLAKVALPPGAPVRSGAFARVDWPVSTGTSIVIPAGAVARHGQIERVFVVHEGTARLRIVRTAGADARGVRINAGIEPGESVILDPPAALRDGSPVTPRS